MINQTKNVEKFSRKKGRLQSWIPVMWVHKFFNPNIEFTGVVFSEIIRLLSRNIWIFLAMM